MSFYCYREIGGENSVEFWPEGDVPDVNFANSNAAMILRSLDYDPGSVMTLDPYDLRERCTQAILSPPVLDDGMPDIVTKQEGGLTMIACGVRPGYFADAYERISKVCDKAIEWRVKVVVA